MSHNSFRDGTLIVHEGSSLYIDYLGNMELVGSVKNVAMGLLKYIIEEEWTSGMIRYELNHVLKVEYDNGFYISYMKDNKPYFFDELTKEFDRLVRMKAFW